MKDEGIIDLYITKVEDKPTDKAKQDFKDARRITIDTNHTAKHQTNAKPQLLQQGKNIGYVLATTVRKLVRKFTNNNQQDLFQPKTDLLK